MQIQDTSNTASEIGCARKDGPAVKKRHFLWKDQHRLKSTGSLRIHDVEKEHKLFISHILISGKSRENPVQKNYRFLIPDMRPASVRIKRFLIGNRKRGTGKLLFHRRVLDMAFTAAEISESFFLRASILRTE